VRQGLIRVRTQVELGARNPNAFDIRIALHNN
jgi:hypothetical protein